MEDERAAAARLRSLDDRAADAWRRRATTWHERHPPKTSGVARRLAWLDTRVAPWIDRNPAVFAATLGVLYLLIAIPVGLAYHAVGLALILVIPYAGFPLVYYLVRLRRR